MLCITPPPLVTLMQRTWTNGIRQLVTLALAVGMWVGVAPPVGAEPILLSATLAGDGRLENPDDLSVLVTITGDTTSNVAHWIVDLTMNGAHAAAALHEFYFNLLGGSTDYTLSTLSAATWGLTTDVASARGSGNGDFMFELKGPNNTVTNSVSLSFDLTKNEGLFTLADFLLAPDACSRDAALGCGDLGAHLGSLSTEAGLSDSGFALGNYGVAQAPEPGIVALFGLGVAGLVARRRHNTSSN